jgi:hypothetical protein
MSNVAEAGIESHECALLALQQAGKIAVLRTADALVVDGDSIMTRRRDQVGDLGREVLVDLELHAGSLGHRQDVFTRQFSSIGDRGVNPLFCEGGVALQDLSHA